MKNVCKKYVVALSTSIYIFQAPVSFFDVTPIGRILNRFSSDVYSVDDSLPFILNILLAQIFGIFGTVVVTCYGLPWFSILLPPLGAIYYFIQVSELFSDFTMMNFTFCRNKKNMLPSFF